MGLSRLTRDECEVNTTEGLNRDINDCNNAHFAE